MKKIISIISFLIITVVLSFGSYTQNVVTTNFPNPVYLTNSSNLFAGTFIGTTSSLTNTYVDDVEGWQVINTGASASTFGMSVGYTMSIGDGFQWVIRCVPGASAKAIVQKWHSFISAALIDSSKTNFVLNWDYMVTNTLINLTNNYQFVIFTNGVSSKSYYAVNSANVIDVGVIGTNTITRSFSFNIPYSILTNTFYMQANFYNNDATNKFLLDMEIHN